MNCRVKKSICLILALTLIVFNSISINANHNTIEAKVYDSYEEFEADYSFQTRSIEVGTVLTAAVIWKYGTGKCELIIFWRGKYLYGEFKWNKIEISDNSIFSDEVYFTSTNGYRYCPAKKISNFTVDDFYLDEEIEKVRIYVDDIQGYNVTNAKWDVGITWRNTITIN